VADAGPELRAGRGLLRIGSAGIRGWRPAGGGL